ncbi:hypothetical protein NECAME_04892 [Necator americanus]|uniref:Uncharacterized protein n=1 Tax=Necator americanus TaxID=51031 RepID=W2SLC3_NECAM|nr:hypothetical protein NECAME_04892 [Necator americanus]ETN70469.1 hypothetical protein NECAME_04892 [Necator americanus]
MILRMREEKGEGEGILVPEEHGNFIEVDYVRFKVLPNEQLRPRHSFGCSHASSKSEEIEARTKH